MKNRLMIVVICLAVSLINRPVYADACPIAEGINPQAPPGGWTLFISPMFQGNNSQPQNYYFVAATHSVSQTYYFAQVFCRYETCSTFGCPNFTLISSLLYKQPASNLSPWDVYPTITNTVVCTPKNHDPFQCMFTNLATQ